MKGMTGAQAALAVALLGASFAACGSDDESQPKEHVGVGGFAGAAGSGGLAGTDGGGSDGGPSFAPVCVKAPTPAAWPGDATCPAPVPGVADALDDALGQAGVDRCSYGFSDDTMSIWKPIFADDKYQLPVFRPLHLGLLRLTGYAKESEAWLAQSIDEKESVSSVILHAGVRKGYAIDGCANLNVFALASQDSEPLAAAIAELIQKNGGTADCASISADTSGVPLEMQQALVPVLASIDWAAGEFQAALGTSDLDDTDWLDNVHAFVIATTVAYNIDAAHVALLANVDQERITLAAAVVARAVEIADLGRFAGMNVGEVAIDTPIGAVVLGGPGDDTYAEGHLAEKSALFVDTGGNDVYEVPIGAGRRFTPVSVAVDLGGADRYGYAEVPSPLDKPTRPPADAAGRSTALGWLGQTSSRVGRQGSGVLGIGLLWDLGTDADEYHSLSLSQGAGSLGVGVLFDEGGDDLYVAECVSQGAALWGIGALVDRAGKDQYKTFFASQGFGFVQGVGMLADGAGDDVYFADPGDPAVGGDPLYASAQLPGSGNTSMSQGAGYGRRDDTTQLYMAGGAGVLFDRAGNDQYTASVFAQGTGYWMGFGMLLDQAGDDSYKGLWYVQGAAAHFALALQIDRAGNDHYNESFPIRATSIGVGHDFSGALHIDLGGDDEYTAPGLSLGCGNSQGIGGLINLGGADHYMPQGSNTYGCASMGHDAPFDATRDVRPTIGIFVDAQGADTYDLPSNAPAAADGASWSYPVYASTPGAPPSEMSGGVDRDPGDVSVP